MGLFDVSFNLSLFVATYRYGWFQIPSQRRGLQEATFFATFLLLNDLFVVGVWFFAGAVSICQNDCFFDDEQQGD